MDTLTVNDLRIFLSCYQLPIEEVGKEVKLPAAILRQLLRQKGEELIPSKYQDRFSAFMLETMNRVGTPFDVRQEDLPFDSTKEESLNTLLFRLEKEGAELDDLSLLKSCARGKLFGTGISQQVIDGVRSLLQALTSKNLSFRHKSICIGALIYFVNILDIIPDTTPIVGFLDDLGVLSLALQTVTGKLLRR